MQWRRDVKQPDSSMSKEIKGFGALMATILRDLVFNLCLAVSALESFSAQLVILSISGRSWV